MGTRDAIGILRSLGEKSAHITKPYEKAFGSHLSQAYESLDEVGC